MEILVAFLLFILLFGLSYFLFNSSLVEDKNNPFKIEVPQKTAYVIDRFGKSRVIEEGFQTFFPFIDEIEQTVSLKEELISPDKLEIFTLDNQKINLDYRVFYKVIDPVKALNNVDDYQATLKSLIIISTLNVMSNTNADDINTSSIQKIRDEIEQACKNWGIEIPQILFDDISL